MSMSPRRETKKELIAAAHELRMPNAEDLKYLPKWMVENEVIGFCVLFKEKVTEELDLVLSRDSGAGQ